MTNLKLKWATKWRYRRPFRKIRLAKLKFSSTQENLRIFHLVWEGPGVLNPGDGIMSIAFKQLVHELEPSVSIRSAEIRDVIKCTAAQRRSIFAGFDLIVLGGGGLYMPFFPWHQLTWLLDLEQPIVLYAIGFNQHFGRPKAHTEQKLDAIRSINDKAILSSVRDDSSKNFLNKLGCSSVKIICDPAAAYIPQRTKSSKPHPIRIGINVPAHGIVNQSEVHRNILPILARFLGDLSKRNFQLHYMVHDVREREIVTSLAPLRFIVHKKRPIRLAAAYSDLDLNIGGMLHSSIFAFSAGVPFICLAYDEKQSAFLRLINREQQLLRIDSLSLEGLSELFEQTLLDCEFISLNIKKSKKKLRSQHLNFIQTALDVVT